MTTQEIRDLVAKKIAGQGTMVDVDGGLPAILNGILDLIAAAAAQSLAVPTLTAEESELGDRIEITAERYYELISSPIIKGYNGKIFTLCTGLVGGYLENIIADYSNSALYFNNYTMDSDGYVMSCSGFLVGQDSNGSEKYYFVPVDI